MTPEAIREHLRRQPFQPFRMCLSDGSVYEVRQPEMVFVMRREIVIGFADPGDELPERAVFCDPLHITRIELINGRGGGSRPKPRR